MSCGGLCANGSLLSFFSKVAITPCAVSTLPITWIAMSSVRDGYIAQCSWFKDRVTSSVISELFFESDANLLRLAHMVLTMLLCFASHAKLHGSLYSWHFMLCLDLLRVQWMVLTIFTICLLTAKIGFRNVWFFYNVLSCFPNVAFAHCYRLLVD